MTDLPTAALRPCPFCGGNADFFENEIDFVPWPGVQCRECDAMIDASEGDDYAAMAMRWNARAAVPAQCDSAKRRASKRLFGNAAWLDRPDMSDQMDDPFSDDDGSRCRMITPNELIAEIEAADRLIPAEDERPPYEDLRKTNVELMAKLRDARAQVEELKGSINKSPWIPPAIKARMVGPSNPSTERQDG